MINEQHLKHDLFTMFEEQQALEFSKWVYAVEKHVGRLKTKLCNSCNKSSLEVVSMDKAKCNNCQTLNDF